MSVKTTEMIDRVAAALDQVSQTASTTLSYAGMMRAFAKAAIEAMREPTEEMRQAGIKAGYAQKIKLGPEGATAKVAPIYTAMVDAALKEDDDDDA